MRLLTGILVRAPLLPAGDGTAAALVADPLGPAALELASSGLSAALARGQTPPALDRFARRAAFRATPHGLLGGVAAGTLDEVTRLHTAGVGAHVAPSWGRLAALGRELLDDPAVRSHVRVRRAPSLLRRDAGPGRGARAMWLGPGGEAREEELPAAMCAVLDAAEDWLPWPAAARRARRAFARDPVLDEVTIDELLLAEIDGGLLHHDLAPPLCGREPLAWMQARLRAIPPARALARELAAVSTASAATSAASAVPTMRALLAGLPGAGHDGPPLHAVLVHRPRAATVSRPAAERAAALAPLLFALQDALAPPARERALYPVVGEALDAATETLGAGAFELAALALGDYGTRLAPPGAEAEPGASSLSPALLAMFARGLATGTLDLTASELRPLVAQEEREVGGPATFELVLTPCVEPAGAAPGTGWLLGLHAPAGASTGRFAAALGAPARRALAELASAERNAFPGEARVDVAFAPSGDLADLCAHPPARTATLALSSWPDGPAVTPADLELCADPSLPASLAWRARDGRPVCPSPLHRVRSTTAPPGPYQLLAGWSLWRQHAPWALAWGPLAGLDRLPRVSVDGFVVAPASWRVPDDVRRDRPGALAAWRARAGVPRHVQAGHEDELLPVDLDAPGAAAELAHLAADPAGDGFRVHEIWPPLDRLADHGGRRVEVVVAVVDPAAAHDPAPTREAAPVPPPAERGPAPGWRTFLVHGDEDRQDRVLVDVIAPLVRATRRSREIDAWFFLRYTAGPGRRDHLRVRVHAGRPAALARFERRLDRALAGARATGDVVSVETAPFFPEHARFGGPASLRVFEAGSDLACALLALPGEAAPGEAAPGEDRVSLLVRVFDALARGLGLDLPARQALAAARRRAEPAPDLAAAYRARHAALVAALAGRARDAAEPLLAAHARRLRRLPAPPPRALPALLHLDAVRLCGLDRAVEAAAYVFWQRALEGVAATGTRSPRRSPSRPRRR